MKATLLNLIICSATFLVCNPALSSEEVLSIEDLLSNAQEIQSQMLDDKRTEAFVLVSFSMPEQSLRRLAQDAKDAGIPLVFRGVPYEDTVGKEGSEESEGPEETKETMKSQQVPLLNPKSLSQFAIFTDHGVQVELNPEIFEELSVTKVPALVIRTNTTANPFNDKAQCNKSDPKEKVVIVEGDVTLGYMLDSLLDRTDDAGLKAQELRRLLGGRQ
ncbi:MAG: type-F conjugative transfer system pilin assembly protein TrbC [Burkholderiales bacterium]|nr:type-F conjugative transfer system pilin assembly protein TrbC [Burkholderiales bacterium]